MSRNATIFLSEIMEVEKLPYFIYRNSVNGPVGFKEGLSKESNAVKERKNLLLEENNKYF